MLLTAQPSLQSQTRQCEAHFFAIYSFGYIYATFNKLIFKIWCIYTCLQVPGCKGQEKNPGPLELESQEGVSYTMWMLRIKLYPVHQRQCSDLLTCLSSPTEHLFVLTEELQTESLRNTSEY